jgi:hypothetical protein
MANLSEMLEYIEARLAMAGEQPYYASHKTVFGKHGDTVADTDASEDAQIIAALLNAAPGIVAAARAMLPEANELNESDHQPDYRLGSGLLTGMGALLTPLYDELKAQDDSHA